MSKDITQKWIKHFEDAEREILHNPEPDAFDNIMLDAIRSQLASLHVELEKDDESRIQEKTKEGKSDLS